MIFVQSLLLKVALDNRPSAGAKEGIEHVPFSGHQRQESSSNLGFRRPYNFWRWRSEKLYVFYNLIRTSRPKLTRIGVVVDTGASLAT